MCFKGEKDQPARVTYHIIGWLHAGILASADIQICLGSAKLEVTAIHTYCTYIYCIHTQNTSTVLGKRRRQLQKLNNS